MKKYLQYNAAQYLKQANEISARQDEGQPVTNDSVEVLDLSGKFCQSSVAMVTGQKWKEEIEQDAALDLSRSKLTEDGDQYEALDLSKPSVARAQPAQSPKPHPPAQSPGINPTHQALQSLAAATSQSKPLIGQYSLLQAALNSTPPITTVAQGIEKMAQLEAELRARLLVGGINALDPSRTIKPFSSGQSRPLGISMPHFTIPSSSIAVVQGIHKPVAITTPQPHQSLVNSKGSAVSQNSDISQSNSCSSNPLIPISQSEFMAGFQHVNQSMSPKGMIPGAYIARGDNKREQFVIRTPDSTSQINAQMNYMKMGNPQGFACSQCPKVFKNKAALKLHTTVHKSSEERQYECQVCKRRFLHRHHLVVHQRKHSGEKPFKCNACSKTFMAIFLLHKHLRKHVRESGVSSEISTEQLKQLHVRKITSDGPGGNLKVVGNVTNPVNVDGPPVTLREEEEKNREKLPGSVGMKPNNVDKNDITASTNAMSTADTIISISSDDLNSSTSTLSASNSSALKDLSEMPKPSNSAQLSSDNNQGNNSNLIHADGVIDPKTVVNVDEKIATAQTKLNDDLDKGEDMSEKVVDPYVGIGSDDEVELDFITGQLRVVGRKEELTSDQAAVMEDQQDEAKSSEAGQISTDTKAEQPVNKVTEKETDAQSDIKEKETDAQPDIKKKETNAQPDKKELKTSGTDISDNTDKGAEGEGDTDDITSVECKKVLSAYEFHRHLEHSCTPLLIKDNEQEKESKNSTNENISTPEQMDAKQERKRKSQDFSVEPDVKKVLIDTVTEINQENDSSEVKDNQDKDSEDRLTKNMDENIEVIAQGKTIKRSKKGRRAKCELCCRTFHSNHHLLLHMAVHKKNPMLMSLKKAKANQMKVLGYNGKSSVNCNICKKVFKFQKSLNSHMRVHSEKLKQNKLISKAFRDFMSEAVPSSHKQPTGKQETESQVSATEEMKTDGSEATTVAEEDDSGPSTLSHVQVCGKSDVDEDPPIKVIIGEDLVRRFLCHACNNTYTTKQKLKMHALIHKDNCFLCDICGKSFFREVTLEKHIATHLLPRPYVCNICKKSFIHRSSLMRHKVVHEKPSMPSLKQQVADVNFELKMLDTYTMLRQERMQKIQFEKMRDVKIEPEQSEVKSDILDLSVRVKMDDASLPPVLSPAISQSSLPPQCTSDLSPPLITKESTITKACDQYEQLKQMKREYNNNEDVETGDLSPGKGLTPEKRKRSISNSNDSQGPNTTDNNTFQKTTRKTRVYETSCRVCREKFPNVMSLKSHMTVHNTVETHLYECHICQHRFTQSCSLLRHLKTSCQENRMTCLPCGKTFHRRNTYDQHMKLHQVGPPSLDGSFYDKRKDEAEIKEEVERESDIENNNTKAAEVLSVDIQVKDEPPPVLNFIPSELNTNEDTSYSTDSDARTYLYSEGEIHMGPLSDFSDSDFSPPQSPKPEMARTVLPSNTSPNIMTLNLLSAVCSDIRNAEKEEEQRRKEMEERQKELETIEILANLKREAMRNSLDSDSSTKQSVNIPTSSPHLLVPTETHTRIVDLSKDKSNISAFDLKKDLSVSKDFSLGQPYYHLTKLKSEPVHYTTADIKSPPLPTESKLATGDTQQGIPTVVLEVDDEAEQHKLEKLNQMKQNQVIQVKTGKDNRPMIDEKTQNMLKELSRMNVYNSIIQERLSLLMKAQPSSSQNLPSTSSSSVAMTTSPSFVSNASKLFPSQIQTVKSDQDPNPQDLSVKKVSHPTEGPFVVSKDFPKGVPKVTEHEQSRSNMSPTSLPPIVPMLRCVLCEKIMYNHVDLCTHMREHNISPETFKKRPPIVPVVDPRWNRHFAKSSRSSELPTSSVSSTSSPELPTAESHQDTLPLSKPEPPMTLDLSSKPSPGKLKLLTTATGSLHSPSAGSDFSDTVSSPSTPSAWNLDHLRIELRNKIYARRRSQGLEDLTVEFKPPEPTEMTEEERRKLDYRRECNRQAAQRSRMRKKDLVDTLLEELHKEEIVNSDLRRKMESLMAEKSLLLKALDSHTCVNINVEKSENG